MILKNQMHSFILSFEFKLFRRFRVYSQKILTMVKTFKAVGRDEANQRFRQMEVMDKQRCGQTPVDLRRILELRRGIAIYRARLEGKRIKRRRQRKRRSRKAQEFNNLLDAITKMEIV